MTPDPDDALTWDGDEDPATSPPALPKGWSAVGKGSDEVEQADTDADVARSVPPTLDDEPASMSSVMLLVTGVVGGIYLLYSIGWIIGGLRLEVLASFLVSDIMFVPWFVLAVAAPPLWFLTTWVLTRGKASWIRASILLLGVVLLVPWPFVTLGVVGS